MSRHIEIDYVTDKGFNGTIISNRCGNDVVGITEIRLVDNQPDKIIFKIKGKRKRKK